MRWIERPAIAVTTHQLLSDLCQSPVHAIANENKILIRNKTKIRSAGKTELGVDHFETSFSTYISTHFGFEAFKNTV